MFKNLSYKQRQSILLAGIVFSLYIGYVFSFKNTLAAIALNLQLTNEHSSNEGADSAAPQVSRKNIFYTEVLKSYYVKKEDAETRLWQTVSGLAIAVAVEINYNPINLPVDTLSAKNKIVTHQYTFKGRYFNIVKLLDTLSKTKGIGRVSKIRLGSKKQKIKSNGDKMLSLFLTLAAIER